MMRIFLTGLILMMAPVLHAGEQRPCSIMLKFGCFSMATGNCWAIPNCLASVQMGLLAQGVLVNAQS